MTRTDDMFLRIYPDPILKKRAGPFSLPLPKNIHAIGEKMVEIMYEEFGIGLAGPQAGISKRIIVYDLSEERDDPHILINPEIVAAEGRCENEEGCLSFPEIRGMVVRSEKVKVRGLDTSGQSVEIEADELMAAMFQHEIDHLDGITFVDRLSPSGKMQIRHELKDLEGLALTD